ncbi:sigma-70 family RNA polymerase sigma factor [Clostridium lacusfryxellense]|uniref:sigma-70 family RNA polymerase sigma factor n=1 Tax=Clostridium lacusfryxellense TaxID=205328 RepID=UPI001C0B72DF|nr:sigma-70 family RNA polymerase sigma factor [Clostridium lacusfryxellense]MBU3111239.1 sigma-70 family RNA polymerase sigma factor [Clostridium lacusfryxellense]
MDTNLKIKLAQKGDDNAFYELISERKSQLYKTAFAYVKNKEEAMDIVSDTVYKAYISIKKLKEPSFFNTWLTRILINTSLDSIKKSSKAAAFEENICVNTGIIVKDDEQLIDLNVAVDNLNGEYKTIVILKYFQDMTLIEISKILQCPLGTVKTRLHKALGELRLDLKEELL